MRKPVSFTYVTYESGDHLGHLLAFSSLMPMALLCAMAGIFAVRRQLRTAGLLAMHVVLEGFCILLKDHIRSPRPLGAEKDDHGMPSSHAAFMHMFAIFCIFTIIQYREMFGVLWKRILACASLMCAAFVVDCARVYHGFHTVEQVAVGVAIGSGVGIVYFFIERHVLIPHIFKVVAGSWVGKQLLLKASVPQRDYLLHEYNQDKKQE